MVVQSVKQSPASDTAQTATVTVDKDNYTEVITIQKTPTASVVVQLKENNVTAATYKVQGSVLGTLFEDLENDSEETEFALDKDGTAYRVVFEPWGFVRVVAKGDGSGDGASVTVDASGG